MTNDAEVAFDPKEIRERTRRANEYQLGRYIREAGYEGSASVDGEEKVTLTLTGLSLVEAGLMLQQLKHAWPGPKGEP